MHLYDENGELTSTLAFHSLQGTRTGRIGSDMGPVLADGKQKLLHSCASRTVELAKRNRTRYKLLCPC
jgi:hypothetical protein